VLNLNYSNRIAFAFMTLLCEFCTVLSKFRSCYNKCTKLFFGYKKYDSVIGILFETGLPSFETVYHNAKCKLTLCTRMLSYNNSVVLMLRARTPYYPF